MGQYSNSRVKYFALILCFFFFPKALIAEEKPNKSLLDFDIGEEAAASFWGNISKGISGTASSFSKSLDASANIYEKVELLSKKIDQCGKCTEKASLIRQYNELLLGWDYMIALQQSAFTGQLGDSVSRNPLLGLLTGAKFSAGDQCSGFQYRWADCVSENVAFNLRSNTNLGSVADRVFESCSLEYSEYYSCRAESQSWYGKNLYGPAIKNIEKACEISVTENLLAPATTGDIKTVCSCVSEKVERFPILQVYKKDLLAKVGNKTVFRAGGLGAKASTDLVSKELYHKILKLNSQIHTCLDPLAISSVAYFGEKLFDIEHYEPSPGKTRITYKDRSLIKSKVETLSWVMIDDSEEWRSMDLEVRVPFINIINTYIPGNSRILQCTYKVNEQTKTFKFWLESKIPNDKEIYSILHEKHYLKQVTGVIESCPLTFDSALASATEFINSSRELIDITNLQSLLIRPSTIDWTEYLKISEDNILLVHMEAINALKFYVWWNRGWSEPIGITNRDYGLSYRIDQLILGRINNFSDSFYEAYDITNNYETLFSQIDGDIVLNLTMFQPVIEEFIENKQFNYSVGFVAILNFGVNKKLDIHVYRANDIYKTTVAKVITRPYLKQHKDLLKLAYNNATVSFQDLNKREMYEDIMLDLN